MDASSGSIPRCELAPPHCRPRAEQGIVPAQISILEGGNVPVAMSALGHKRTYAVQKGMSALPLKADMQDLKPSCYL
jgi:hypothetical protein